VPCPSIQSRQYRRRLSCSTSVSFSSETQKRRNAVECLFGASGVFHMLHQSNVIVFPDCIFQHILSCFIKWSAVKEMKCNRIEKNVMNVPIIVQPVKRWLSLWQWSFCQSNNGLMCDSSYINVDGWLQNKKRVKSILTKQTDAQPWWPTRYAHSMQFQDYDHLVTDFSFLC